MAPGFGQQPRFIVTIQPVGTTFNPPAAISLPNVDGLQPRAVTEMYSYDHDLGMFVAIGTGTVSADGSMIVSNPGVGVLKAGWHCGGNPNSSGFAANLTLTASPTVLSGAPGDFFFVGADGTPPLDGEYSWEIIATQPGDDPGVAEQLDNLRCPSSPNCAAALAGVRVGTATLRVHFHCLTTGLEAPPVDIRITIQATFQGALTPEDNFAGRSMTRFGVAEGIDLSFTTTPAGIAASGFGGLHWRIVSGDGTITAGTDGKGTYFAPAVAATVVLRLEVASGPSKGAGNNYTINVVAPSDARMIQKIGTNALHIQGYAGVGFIGAIFFDPTDVSFANVEWSEGEVPGKGTGFYNYLNGFLHVPGSPVPLGNCNTKSGCSILGFDKVSSGFCGPQGGAAIGNLQCKPEPFSVGDFNWPIPWYYDPPDGTITSSFTIANQHWLSDAVGTVTIMKKNTTPITRKVNDPSSSY
jgi:hypothetical protein